MAELFGLPQIVVIGGIAVVAVVIIYLLIRRGRSSRQPEPDQEDGIVQQADQAVAAPATQVSTDAARTRSSPQPKFEKPVPPPPSHRSNIEVSAPTTPPVPSSPPQPSVASVTPTSATPPVMGDPVRSPPPGIKRSNPPAPKAASVAPPVPSAPPAPSTPPSTAPTAPPSPPAPSVPTPSAPPSAPSPSIPTPGNVAPPQAIPPSPASSDEPAEPEEPIIEQFTTNNLAELKQRSLADVQLLKKTLLDENTQEK